MLTDMNALASAGRRARKGLLASCARGKCTTRRFLHSRVIALVFIFMVARHMQAGLNLNPASLVTRLTDGVEVKTELPARRAQKMDCKFAAR